MPSHASAHGRRPEPTSAAAPATAQRASGNRQGRAMTQPIVSPAMPHVAAAASPVIATTRSRGPVSGSLDQTAAGSPTDSIRLRSGGADHLGPFRRLGLHEGAEIFGEGIARLGAELANARDDVGLPEHLAHFAA